jgi:hypothetical protein
MEVAQILEELAYDMGVLPREAIEAAISKRRLITPYLLKILEDAANQIEEIIEFDNYQGHLYAMYLLAQFREKAAYPFIIKLISYPDEIPHSIVGDVLTEDLSRILASVSSGDIEPLQSLVENPHISEYVRAAAQTSMVTLVGCGMHSREKIMKYFKSLFYEKLEKRPSFVWDNLVSCCCDLYPQEVTDEIQEAFASGLVDPCFISLEEIGAILAESKENHLFRLFQNAELIDDTVTEMEKWLSTHI